MNRDEDFKRQIELTIQKSHRLLQTAKIDLESGDNDSASSRAYYSVFHMMEACLLTKGLTYSKHSAVISAFNLHFIKPGIFPRIFYRNIEKLFKDRQLGDYEVESNIDNYDTSENIKIAEDIVNSIEDFLKKEGKYGVDRD